jgi:hypothetical protein
MPSNKCLAQLVGVVSLACLLGCREALASSTTGNAMLPGCRNSLNDTAPSTYTGGLCMGVIITAAMLGDYLPLNLRACPPTGVTFGQTLRVVVDYMEKNPNQLHKEFPFLVVLALNRAWPCPVN